MVSFRGRRGIGRPEGRHCVLAVTLLLFAARDALACPICFGASDAPLAVGMNWGVLTLLGVTLGVLAGFAVLFVRLVRRSEREIGPAEAGPCVPKRRADAGPGVWPEEGDPA